MNLFEVQGIKLPNVFIATAIDQYCEMMHPVFTERVHHRRRLKAALPEMPALDPVDDHSLMCAFVAHFVYTAITRPRIGNRVLAQLRLILSNTPYIMDNYVSNWYIPVNMADDPDWEFDVIVRLAESHAKRSIDVRDKFSPYIDYLQMTTSVISFEELIKKTRQLVVERRKNKARQRVLGRNK